MKCDGWRGRVAVGLLAACRSVIVLSCQESLPVYVKPTNILALEVSTVEQLNDRAASPADHQVVRFVVSCENTHDEVYYDSVDIRGSLRIWWKRKPQRYRTIYLTAENFRDKGLVRNEKLLIVPGQTVSLEAMWNLRSDDSLYLPTEMNFAFLRRRVCGYNIACADPEEFVVEASLNLFDRLGYISAPPVIFSFIGRVCIECGVGPVCPPPPSGCGP